MEDDIPQPDGIPGLRFRNFQCSDEDYRHYARIINGSREADKAENFADPQEVREDFESSPNFDPKEDVFFAELGRTPVGAGVAWWSKDPLDRMFLELSASLLPEYRGGKIRNAIVRECERRLRMREKEHGKGLAPYFRAWAFEHENDLARVLKEEGFGVMRRGLTLVRENLDGIPSLPLPDGIETRPVLPEHYPKIIAAWNDAAKDMRGQALWNPDEFEKWAKMDDFDPSLWVVAWKGNEVVGTVLGLIFKKQNELQGRLRGHTEFVSTARAYRRQGIATALIARCLIVLRERGMTSAAIGVDEGNPSKAYLVYQNLGFKVEKTVTAHWKSLDGTAPPPM